jgi:hypothetical protein
MCCIHAQEDAQAAKEKAHQVVEKLRAMKLATAGGDRGERHRRNAQLLRSAAETLALSAHQQPAK